MTTPTDQLSPETLEKYFRSGTVTVHHVNDSPEVDITIDGPGQKISVLTPRKGMVLNTTALRRVTTGVDVRDGQEWARFTLDARGMYAEAYGLVISVVQAMRGGATFAAATSAAMTNMKALLAAKPRISEEKQIGLVGELLLFRALLDTFDEYTVIDWWLGPLAEEHDYAFPAFDAEVKTTLGESRTHVIHGAGQLEPSPGRFLWLVSVQITRAGGNPDGVGLPGLIHEIRERLAGTRDRFVSHLSSEGWDDDDAAMYPTAYVLRTTPAAYLVDDDFPAVTRERLRSVVPHSDLVSDVTYRVNVSGRTAGSPGKPLDTFVALPPFRRPDVPDPYTEAVVAAVRSMSKASPKPMLKRVQFELEDAGVTGEFTESDLVAKLTSADVNEPARYEFHIQLAKWDSANDPAWSTDSAPNTADRRHAILNALGFSLESHDAIDQAFPVNMTGAVVISGKPADWDPWYTSDVVANRSFYWDGYRSVLEAKGWSANAVGELDRTTDEVVKRLANPTRSDPYQSKGLVVGHVQSGKTANFTGVIAKAIDAGYKLVIVLTGTIELLRGQTQRRLDMELIGEENILGGVARDNHQLIATVDYIGDGDVDWQEGRFLKYGKDPKELGFPGIRRLTGSKDDYKLLKAGLGYLDFRQTDHLVDPARPLYHEKNIHKPDIRIAVVKKNSAVLKKLVRDLQATKTDLGEIPALIIDDEADQASINTTRPKKDAAEAKERTAINRLIAQLLDELKRAQYVGYTATPFANVFVDPDDAQDIFPKDFIVSLDPPDDYMGGRDFHDLGRGVDDEDDLAGLTFASSNEKAFVRSLVAGPDDPEARDKEMLAALDAYVLSGAIKLFRAVALGTPKLFRHHTMLVHESVRTGEHEVVASDIRRIWASAGYDLPAGLKRLHDLWISDFRPVMEARAHETFPIPDFRALREHIGHAVDKIQQGVNPVVIVNGVAEKDYLQADINFQAGDVWKILVGGAKLSRGFTVEGLTISYYTRRTIAADTLMQMGRWFGYRPHYHDLVRLYIGRNVPAPRHAVIDLYKSFEAIVRDEEDFRDELRKFQGFEEDGRPRVRPMDVPPLVYQSLPYLKPTSTNKMYNAELTEQGEGGKVIDFNQQGEHDDDVNRTHFTAVQPLLDAASDVGDFFYINPTGDPRPWRARYGIVDAGNLIDIISQFSWAKNFKVAPYIAFMHKAIAEGTLKDWAIIVPEIDSLQARTVEGRSLRIMRRFRRSDRPWQFSGSSTRQRDALLAISSGIDADTVDTGGHVAAALELPEYAHVKALKVATRGALLLTFAGDSASPRFHDAERVTDPKLLPDPTNPRDVATLFSYALPLASAPAGRIAFAVRRPDRPEDPIVDADAHG